MDEPPNSVAESLERSFAAWASTYLYAELLAVPGLFWIGWPLVGPFVPVLLERLVLMLTRSVVMRALFANAAAVRVELADNYASAVAAAKALPADAPKEARTQHEIREMVAFCDLVLQR